MKAKAQKSAVCMGEITLKVQELIKKYPPVFESPRKKSYYEKAAYIHRKQKGIVKISRWRFADERKTKIDLTSQPLEIEEKKTFFDYADEDTETKRVWYLNFADPLLFGYYNGDLFAQDEIQTFEHPLLGAVVEYLNKKKIPGMEDLTLVKRKPTPYLIEKIPYWIRVNTSPVLKDGKIANIYGHNFQYASKEVLEAGIRLIEKEETNNILAIAAPSSGHGNDLYTQYEIQLILKTLLVGFSACARRTSASKRNECVIHTGNWGCGAFGNDKELIYFCQILCASVCGVSKLVFHGLSDEDSKILETAKKKLAEKSDSQNLTDFLMAQNYRWHFGDGN